MVNLLPGPTRDFMHIAKRIAAALEDIAQHLTTRPAEPVIDWLPNMNPEVGLHAQLGCDLDFTYAGPGPTTVWCNTHNTELSLILGPVVPPLDDADLATLRAKLEGRG